MEEPTVFKPHFPRSEPEDIVDSVTLKVVLGCGTIYMIINIVDGKPFRLILKKGHTGRCEQALLEAYASLVTIIFQETDVPLERVVKKLRGIACEKGIVGKQSCMDALAQHFAKLFLKAAEQPGGEK